MASSNVLDNSSETQLKEIEIIENNNLPVLNIPIKIADLENVTASTCPLRAQSGTNKRKAPDRTETDSKLKKSSNPPKKFIYGNYDRYYGYRNPKDSQDIRLDVFHKYADSLFRGADILDIGCNSGLVTLAVSRDLEIRSSIGIDIDASLIKQAKIKLSAERRRLSSNSTPLKSFSYPLNVSFTHGNYVLSDPKLLDLEQPKFDTILCLSTTKWIHLNFGDVGLQLAFKRMFRQLRPGGQLVLEAQDWKTYKKRKRLSETILSNFASIQMHPQQFPAYLLGSEVGFERSYMLSASKEHVAKGFRRPIHVYVKAGARKLVDSASGEENDKLLNGNKEKSV